MIGVGDALQHALEERGEPGAPELCQALPELRHAEVGLRRLKAKVYRLEVADGAPWRSVVLKRLAPGVAECTRLLADRWLPALGLGDRCPRLLRVAAERGGQFVWHVYEDLGGETLAEAPEQEQVEAAVDLVAELHTRAARHPILPEVRRYGGDLGMRFFIANLRDAIAALDAGQRQEVSGLLRGRAFGPPRRMKHAVAGR